ncbi:unnamed protein product [Periconia digitata]|uniref:Iron-sulfur cluster assembly factor IBA57 homolog, mitochondrial n=1 Tax=Periconia digitata TaxID=1303443 RepID=A0A9W4U5I5_9PLEO|nr:unnamed protein product [Periconia digitata]
MLNLICISLDSMACSLKTPSAKSMSSISRIGLPRKSSYVCESCLGRVRQLRITRLATSRGITSLSSKSPLPRNRMPRIANDRQWVQESHNRWNTPRKLSTNASAASLEIAEHGLAPVPSRRLISLSGPDAAKFLQGLITNNVEKNRDAPFYAAFLDARGRVLWDVFVWVYPGLDVEEGEWACNIEVDGEEIGALLKHLKRHKLRSKISIKTIEESEISVWAGWGLSSNDDVKGAQVLATLVDPRGHKFGTRYLLKGHSSLKNPPVPIVDTQQYHLRRYVYGIPEGPNEIPREAALPMEYNIDLSQGIDFKKGCYVGQELTIRTKHTGVVRKRVLPLELQPLTKSGDQTADAPIRTFPESGTDIKQLDESMSLKKGRPAGKFIAGIGNVGLGLARLEMMTSMRVSAEGGTWKPGTRFGVPVGDEEVVEVRAITPQWFQERERDLWDKNRTRV